MRRASLVVFMTALALVLGFVSSQADAASKKRHAMVGAVLLHGGLGGGQAIRSDNGACNGTNGDLLSDAPGLTSDLVPGASIVIRDGRGRIVATSTLGTGTVSHLVTSGDGSATYDCTLQFHAIVPDASFYEIKVGTHSGVVFSRSELNRRRWRPVIAISS